MLERNNKSGVNRIKNYRDKTGGRHIRCEKKYHAYDKDAEIRKNAEKANERIEYYNERYCSLTKVFMNTINAREIDIMSKDFDEKIEEILQAIFQSKVFEVRYRNDDKQEVKNAILRAVNEQRNRIKSEKGRDDE